MNIAHYRFESPAQDNRSGKKPPVMALHCSGSDGDQWNKLSERLWPHRTVVAPDLIGTHRCDHPIGPEPFRLAEEARHPITQLEMLAQPAHLVGHSYGAALALHIARARPDLVRSLCLYEPTLFSLLDTEAPHDQKLHREIVSLAQAIRNANDEGCHAFSAELFTDFWGGLGAWHALSARRRDAMIDWIKKAPFDFDALLNEPVSDRIIAPQLPVTIMIGAQTHPQTERIANLLAAQGGDVRIVEFEGAGHLGPFTFADLFTDEVHRHLDAVDSTVSTPSFAS